ncbi:MAG: DNA gyrase subunit A [Chlamydiae bacterium]|nr:DNA gyrase subunit A [Chlamydiota bacterium]
MADIKHVFRENYLKYASYVILERAIPHIIDGLKPVQRRILWTLFRMDDGKLHKVANVAGQTMALHPHGDAPIIDALVNLANKGYLLDTQGNFGNPQTGDPPAAARYIETRLGELAKETLFNPDLTPFLPSYDGRAKEPVNLPVKIPLLLMQGAEGIAVGMATKILPHNFTELLKAQIDLLEGHPIEIFPDFPSGGVMDPSEYANGRGKVKVRAKIETRDEKTLVIREICFGTTTESVIRSIDEAAKKGKIKIEAISDYTAEKIEIEIKLPRGQYAHKVLDTLYAFTDCEVSINAQMVMIKEENPWEGTVDEVLSFHVTQLKEYLKTELEIERDRLLEKIFQKTLEQIFIENRLYKKIENVTSYEKVHATIETSLESFHTQLPRIPTYDDRERLLNIQIRRITRFDIEKNEQEVKLLGKKLVNVKQKLKDIKKTTTQYLQGLLKKYGNLFPRKTRIKSIKEIDKKEIAKKEVRVSYDPETGFLGTKVSGPHQIECTSLDKILIVYEDGTYQVVNLPEKQYVHQKEVEAAWIGVADKKTELGVVYRDKKTNYPYSKRFIVKQFILDKEYAFIDRDQVLEYITSSPKAVLKLTFKPKARQKISHIEFAIEEAPLKGASARGTRIANKELKSVKVLRGESK